MLKISVKTPLENLRGDEVGFFSEVKEVSIDSIELKKILQNDYHSLFVFNNNKRSETEAKQMYGLMLDFDDSLTIEEAESIFQSYTYILYSSKSHQQKKKKGKAFIEPRDRFHIILPFSEPINITVENQTEIKDTIKKIVDFLKSDEKAVDLARFFFPTIDRSKPIKDLKIVYKTNDGEIFNLFTFAEYVDIFKNNLNKATNSNTNRNSESNGNDYNEGLLIACMDILISNGYLNDYQIYQNILAWSSGEPDNIKKIVASKLANNPNYDDTEEQILKKTETFKYSNFTFSTIYKLTKEADSTFTQGKYYQKQTDSNNTWNQNFTDKEVIEWFNNNYCYISGVLYQRNKQTGWNKYDGNEKYFQAYQVFREDKEGTIKKVSGFNIWNSSLKRKTYDAVDYFYNKPTPNGYLNLADENIKLIASKDWSNNPEVMKGYNSIKNLIKESICRDDERIFKYLMVWSAYVINFQKTKTSIIITGRQGTGKSLFSLFLGKFLSKTHKVISDPKELDGQFNDALKGTILLTSEEAVWSGDKAFQRKIKQLITQDIQRVNQKYLKPIEYTDYCNYIFNTNEDVVIDIESDDRRFFILSTNPKFGEFIRTEREEKMFDNVYEALDDIRVLEHFQYIFSQIRTSIPLFFLKKRENMMTEQKQKVVSATLDPFLAFLKDAIESGYIYADRSYNISNSFLDAKVVVEKSVELALFEDRFLPITIFEHFKINYLAKNSQFYVGFRSFWDKLAPFCKEIKSQTTIWENNKSRDKKQRGAITLDDQKIFEYLKDYGITVQIYTKNDENEIVDDIDSTPENVIQLKKEEPMEPKKTLEDYKKEKANNKTKKNKKSDTVEKIVQIIPKDIGQCKRFLLLQEKIVNNKIQMDLLKTVFINEKLLTPDDSAEVFLSILETFKKSSFVVEEMI